MNDAWPIESDPPAWLSVSADEVATLRERCRGLHVTRVHLNGDTVDLDSYLSEDLNPSDANPPLAAINRALQCLGTRAVQEAEAKRDRAAEASQELRRRFPQN